MRRIPLLVLPVAAGVAAVLSAGGGGEERVRVDALFANAAGLVAGQEVRVAGALVGTVREISLTRERTARVQLELDPRFGAFRADATCAIRPQSLVGERFVDCSPGQAGAAPLARRGGIPTLPAARTRTPVDLDLVFGLYRRPYRERLAILVRELGTGLAGRTDDLEAAVRRANPALRAVNDVLAVLDRDRRRLRRLVAAADTTFGVLERRRSGVARFIGRSRAFAVPAAARTAELDRALRRLPRLLAELEPAAAETAALAHDARPLVRRLRTASPAAEAAALELRPLASAAGPAVARLGTAARRGRATLRPTGAAARRLEPVAPRLVTVGELAAELSESVRDSGAAEGTLAFVFRGAAAVSRFDRVSHFLPAFAIATSCQDYAVDPRAGCSARFDRPEPVARRASPPADAFAAQRTALDFLLAP